jgi:hypothetical protein
MGYSYNCNILFDIKPPLPAGTQMGIRHTPAPLFLEGFNLPVSVSTSSGCLNNPNFNKDLAASIAVMAHLDTGASRTSIDIGLAEYLKLEPSGMAPNLTAGGIKTMPTFVLDLHFQNANLAPFINLPVSSCELSFDIGGRLNSSKNFALLLGRDILSRWNIVWNGPTSTVFIND